MHLFGRKSNEKVNCSCTKYTHANKCVNNMHAVKYSVLYTGTIKQNGTTKVTVLMTPGKFGEKFEKVSSAFKASGHHW